VAKKEIKYLGEVLESSVHGVTGECYALDELPAYGQPIVAETDPTIIALVSEVRIGSALPGRSLGKRGFDPEELVEQHPEMGELILAEFQAVVIGVISAEVVSLRSPSHPVPLYTRIRAANDAEVTAITLAGNLTARLLRLADNDDSFLIATLAHLIGSVEDKTGFAAETARDLAVLLTEDFPRLEYIMKELRILTE
jgi:hypothetical protein